MKTIITVLTLILALTSCEPTIPNTKEITPAFPTTSSIELGTVLEGHGRLFKIKVDSIEYILFYDGDNSSITKHRDLRNGNK